MFQSFPELLRPPRSTIYQPSIFGFRVNEKSRVGPRMQWLRMRPPGCTVDDDEEDEEDELYDDEIDAEDVEENEADAVMGFEHNVVGKSPPCLLSL